MLLSLSLPEPTGKHHAAHHKCCVLLSSLQVVFRPPRPFVSYVTSSLLLKVVMHLPPSPTTSCVVPPSLSYKLCCASLSLLQVVLRLLPSPTGCVAPPSLSYKMFCVSPPLSSFIYPPVIGLRQVLTERLISRQ